MDAFWIFAIGFFGIMTVFNTMSSIKKKETFAPAIIGLLMTLSILSFFLGKIIFGILFFIASVVVSRVRSRELSKIEEKRILLEFEKIDYKEPIKIKDFLFGWNGWGKIAASYGAKKASLLFSLFFVITLVVMFLILWKSFPAFIPNKYCTLEFIMIVPVIIYYLLFKKFNRIFEITTRM